MIDPRTPCVIGVAQRTYRADKETTPEPLEMWAEICRAAAGDSGGNDVLAASDSLSVVYNLSWQYDDPPRRLAERLGLRDGHRFYSGLSGTTPQQLVQRAGEAILAGERDLAVIACGEALDTKKRLKKEDAKPDWSFRPAERTGMPFDDPFHPAEIAHQVFQAYLTFALFDVARRAHRELSPQQHRQQLGELLAPMSRVAAANPNAWFRREHTPEEITGVTPDNRMVSYPYTKNMVAMMDVDMAAALIVASHEKADALGVPGDRRVYLRGWCYAKDPVYVSEREEMWRSVAMEEAGREAMACAGIGIDDIAYLDLYSCFGSSVEFAQDALGLSSDDSRDLTVTGGLPYHGGPGNGYLTHSIATLVERLRCDPAAYGMVSGVGMHMTNHVYGVYSATPGDVAPPNAAAVQARVDATPRRSIRDTATGPAQVAAYSVLHSRRGPESGLAVCDLPDGSRTYARVEGEERLREMESAEWVGRSVVLRDGGDSVNLVED
jgi:acetyl-CoA C-acetyltransferase